MVRLGSRVVALGLAATLAAAPLRADEGIPCLRMAGDLAAYVEPLQAEGWALATGDDRLRALSGPSLLLHAATVLPDPPDGAEARERRVAEALAFAEPRFPQAAVLTRGEAALLVDVETVPGLGHRVRCVMAAPTLARAAAMLAGATPGPFGDLTIAAATWPGIAGADEVRVEALRLGWAAEGPAPLPGAEGLMVTLFSRTAP